MRGAPHEVVLHAEEFDLVADPETKSLVQADVLGPARFQVRGLAPRVHVLAEMPEHRTADSVALSLVGHRDRTEVPVGRRRSVLGPDLEPAPDAGRRVTEDQTWNW